MKKMIFIAGLLLSLALTAFAEQQGVFMQSLISNELIIKYNIKIGQPNEEY